VDILLDILNNIKIIGPLGVVALIEAYAIYALFNKLEDLQEKRLNDWQAMNKDYQDLSTEINRTLDAILKMFGRKNGNGGN
jgi:cell division protein FtsW (lipid II flippase)